MVEEVVSDVSVFFFAKIWCTSDVAVLSSYSLFLLTACFVCTIGSFGKVFAVSLLFLYNLLWQLNFGIDL